MPVGTDACSLARAMDRDSRSVRRGTRAPRAAWLVAALLVATSARRGEACPDGERAPSSRWSVARSEGAWWLVTPCGERFFSIGVNGLDGGESQALPSDAPGYRWQAFHPRFTDWLDEARGRLTRWGFNTAGAVAPPAATTELPSIPSLWLGASASFHWVDPFDPELPERLTRKAEALVAPHRGHQRRIGYFTDNEVGWWGGALFTFYSKQAASNHTKQRWLAALRERYGESWERFSADFVAPEGVSSWDELLAAQGKPTRLRPGSRGIDAVRAWTGIVASRYYETMHAALAAADPDALDFGDRLPIYYDPMAVRAMASRVDVIATNYNLDAPDGWVARYYFEGLRRLAPHKPVLVSEWFFAAHENRSGNRNNGHLLTVDTQAERARGAARAARNLAAEPNVVGLHWFQYYDHPPGGRPADGEDYDFGLVDVANRPYAGLPRAFAAVNRALGAVHRRAGPRGAGAAASAAAAHLGALPLPHVTIDPTDGHLGDWPKERAWVRDLDAPAPEVPFGDVYLGWNERGLALGLIAMDYYDPALLAFEGAFPVAEALHLDVGVDAGAGPRRLRLSIVPPQVFVKKAAPAFEPRLCRVEGDGCAPVDGARLRYAGSDQPRYRVEAEIPWEAFGVATAPRARRLRAALALTAFHRSRWMSTAAREPDALLADAPSWPLVRLGPADARVTARSSTAR